MPQPARLAIGTVQKGVNRLPMLWAVLDLWRRRGLQVQPFRSRAELASSPGAEVATGRAYRHVDGTMLFPRLCEHLLEHGSRGCDLAVVDGEFNEPGCLENLCNSLDLAGVAVLSAAAISAGHLPRRPQSLVAVLLDEVTDAAEAIRWKIEIEALWKVPVLGIMPHVPALRTVANSLSVEKRPSPQLCRALGDALSPNYDWQRLFSLARRQSVSLMPNQIPIPQELGPRVAVGIDEAMSRYFPENFEVLSSRGAKLLDFSPLRSVAPPDVDIIYLSDGCLHAFAEGLAKNHCLLASLRSHVGAGGLIYAEGMGVALLGRELLLPSGRLIRMAGVMPWSYRLLDSPAPHALQTISCSADNWLMQGCPQLRGYEGCTRLQVIGPEEYNSPDENYSAPIQAWGGVVASTIPLFFPAHPRIVWNLMRMSSERVAVEKF